MKKKILFCSEATFLNTGYSTYTREILNYLYSTGKYDIAEMGSYGEKNDPRAVNIPWKYYGVMPNMSSEPRASKEEISAYSSKPSNQFGEWAFEKVCLDFQPDIVCDIRDFWMMSHEETSPFRDYFRLIWMPTVDAAPQSRQWIASYNSADAILTYSDWAGEVLQEQSGGKMNYLGSAPPSAHPAYRPMDKAKVRGEFGIDPNCKIIGTVMRNQRRKLYPDLFAAFKKFLSLSDDKNIFLYCHTSYPDLGWDIPELLQEYELSSKVLFTYICNDTKKPFASFFRGAIAQSPFTKNFSATLSNVKNGAEYEDLSRIINLFDLYVQYANCEGFGLPIVEAAACGIPVMGTDYSAMTSEIRKLGGFPIAPKALYKELETGCMRAVPDNDLAAKMFLDFFASSKEEIKRRGDLCRKNFEEKFQWHLSGKKWEDYFDSVEPMPVSQTWESSPKIFSPAPKLISVEGVSPANLAKWLIVEVLREPNRLNTYFESRLIRDLTYRSTTSVTGGMYFNESSAIFDGGTRNEFNFDIAYEHMKALCERRNYWENTRFYKNKNGKWE